MPVTHTAGASASTATWQPLGPQAVLSPNYGLVTGRVSSIAIDPSDPTSEHVYIGTTGGGVWAASKSPGASTPLAFTPLTDTPSAISAVRDASISVGALTVQPGGTGVILAGTGDTNDALDSYYGSGVLRSSDGGNAWTLTSHTADQIYSFQGEGFSGFAWSTVNPQLVVAAVSQAYEGMLVNAQLSGVSYAGLYYSTDAGTTWSVATISDGPGQDVQGAQDLFSSPNGNSATAVVWNPIRKLFIAAIRFHGYYQSADGINWTRLTNQPSAGLTSQMCPTNPGEIGSAACPIFRGSLAVNPVSGDTFAWTVDVDNQDKGIWQDLCGISGGLCSNQTVAFSQQWSTAPLDSDTTLGPATVANGDYNLVLAAVPSGQDTLLFAGTNDLWKCSLDAGCTWRNTTNAISCMSAEVAPYQHALAWNPSNPDEIFIGNDSGLWRSTDAIAESGKECSSADSSHFENLNGGLGSLAEVESISQVGISPYTMVAGLGANGTAGVKSTIGPVTDWPQILGGEGGPVAIDPVDQDNWYVSNNSGVSIYRCSQSGNCTPDAFGTAVVTNADVGGDGNTMTSPAPLIVDPLDNTQLLVATCRLWRGSANGTSWTNANAISPKLDDISGQGPCSGNALIRSIAALPVSGSEVIYVGLYGALDGANLPGHIFKAIYNPSSGSVPTWQDLTRNPVLNDSVQFNYYGFDVSSIFVDPHDNTGNTVYVTIEGIRDSRHSIRTLYRSTDGGAHWSDLTSNLQLSPANSVEVDPQDANTVYVATDIGVYSTRQISTCTYGPNNCWSLFGTGLPYAPVVQLSTAPASTSPDVLVAGTYGRGIWQIPLWTAGTQLTTASVDPTTLTFGAQSVGSTSNVQTITLINTGGIALSVASIATSADFSESDDCVNTPVNSGASCAIQVTFTPAQTGAITGQLTISVNVAGGQITIPLAGTGTSAGSVTATPGSLDFGQVQAGETSSLLSITVENATSNSVPLTSVSVTPPFNLAVNACGSSLTPNSDCEISITFAPTQAGPASGTLTLIDGAGTQTVALSGTGTAFDFLLGVSGQSSQTVSSGQTASYSITLTTQGSVLGSFTFACSGLPANSTCAFTPASPTVAANASSTVTMQIATGKSSSTALNSDPGFLRASRILPFACALIALPVAFRRARRSWILTAFFAIVLYGITSCAGAGGGGGGVPPVSPTSTTTPAGTYSITMTATANGVSHKLLLTLTVK